MGEGSNAFRCDKCKKKVDTLKRTTIKKLPRHLCITLKRFNLNYVTMQTEKLNDRVEFPMELDMMPYTSEFLRKDVHQENPNNKQKLKSKYPSKLQKKKGR